MTQRIRLRKRDRGFDLATDDDLQVSTLSGMDAAELLFQMKDELQSTPVGRSCIDQVAAKRRGDHPSTFSRRRWPA